MLNFNTRYSEAKHTLVYEEEFAFKFYFVLLFKEAISPTIYNPAPFSSLLNIKDSVLYSRTPQNATLYSGTLQDSTKVLVRLWCHSKMQRWAEEVKKILRLYS